MPLDETQIQRYARHIVLQEVGGVGQSKLLDAKVLVVGAGGLGSPLLMYLAAAGIGTIGVVDDDTVRLSNLQRQVAHTTDRIGVAKTDSAQQTVAALNPDVTLVRHPVRLVATNALDLIGGYDLVADGSDNFATRFLVNDACYFAGKPLVSAASSPMCGNSVCQDRRFLAVYMPELERFFHYRALDVTSIKIALQLWRLDCPLFDKGAESHRALDDVRASLMECKHYQDFLGALKLNADDSD